MEKIEFSIEDYKNFLKNELKLLEQKAKEIKKDIGNLKTFCYTKEKNGVIYVYSDIANINMLLKKFNNRIIFKDALKAIYGPDFFSEYTEEEKKFCRENGLFTKEDLDEMLKSVYGTKYGYTLKKPNNYNELYEFIMTCFEIFNDTRINQKAKEPYFTILYSIASLMEITCKRDLNKLYKINKKIDIYDIFVKAYNKKSNIELTLEKENEIKEVLSNDERKFTTLEENNNKVLSFSEAYLLFCKNLNECNKEEQEEKESKKVNKKADKYFNKISKRNIDKLDNCNFPDYGDECYSKIMEKLLNKFSGKEEFIEHYAILLMYHAGSFNRKYMDSKINSKTK